MIFFNYRKYRYADSMNATKYADVIVLNNDTSGRRHLKENNTFLH